MKKLDLGCGNNKPEGFLGLNYPETEQTDIVHDLTELPLPFEDSEFGHFRANNVLEHIPDSVYDGLIEEIGRITREGGLVEITGPYYLTEHSVAGDHHRAYSDVSFNVYSVDHDYPTAKPQIFRLRNVEYTWRDRLYLKVLKKIFPSHLLRKHVPNTVVEITFELEVVKDVKNQD